MSIGTDTDTDTISIAYSRCHLLLCNDLDRWVLVYISLLMCLLY